MAWSEHHSIGESVIAAPSPAAHARGSPAAANMRGAEGQHERRSRSPITDSRSTRGEISNSRRHRSGRAHAHDCFAAAGAAGRRSGRRRRRHEREPGRHADVHLRWRERRDRRRLCDRVSDSRTIGRRRSLGHALVRKASPAELRAGPFPAILGTTLPIGASEPVSFVLDRALPAGSGQATGCLTPPPAGS